MVVLQKIIVDESCEVEMSTCIAASFVGQPDEDRAIPFR